MYEAYYGLRANPFRLAPDPQFFYESSCHKRGLAYLRYGLHQGQGFVVVTGVPGTGKSLLVQTIFAELAGRRMVVSSINNTNLEADDVLRAVANSFDVYCNDTSKAALLNALERFLIERNRQGKRVLLIVDEAQNLPKSSLEELRMLSNFQCGDQPLLQIMLLGQQQLQNILADPNMEQLTQRVIASCHLKPLDPVETRGYIEYRLRHVGWRGKPSFTGEALGLIHHTAHGIPRLINTFCDRLLLAAYLDEKRVIDAAHVRTVLQELQNEATGAWLGVDPGAVPAAIPAPLPDGDFLPGDEAVAAVPEGQVPENQLPEKELPEKKLPEKKLPENKLAESPAAAEPLRSFKSKLHVTDKVATVVPIIRTPKPSGGSGVALSGRQVAALAQRSHEESRPENRGQQAYAALLPDEVTPLPETQNDALFGESNVVQLASTVPQIDVDDQPPELVYKDADAGVARRWWLAIGVVALAVIVVLLFMMFADGHKIISRINPFQPSPQNQSVAVESSVPFTTTGGDENVNGDSVNSDSTTALTEATTESYDSGAESPAAEAEIVAEAAVVTPQVVAQPVAVAKPAPVPERVATPVPETPVKAPVVKAAPPPVATTKAIAKPTVAEVKQAPVVPTKIVVAPETEPVVKPAPARVAADLPPPPPLRVPGLEAEPSKRQVDKSAAALAATKPSISDVELPELLYSFVFAYESGDLNRLVGLFADNAMADKSVGRSKIARDYRELFQATDMRRMNIGAISWQPEGNMAQGSGDFEVTVWRRGDETPSTIKGKLNIEVVKADKQLVIRKLTHVVNR